MKRKPAGKLTAAIEYYKALYGISTEELRLELGGICATTLTKKMKTSEFTYPELVTMSKMFYCSVGELADGICKAV